MTAIYYQRKTISYSALLQKIEECHIEDPIFPVTKTLSCVIKILTCLIKGIPFFPYSPLLAKKPALTIPPDCDIVLHTSGSSSLKYALFKKEALLDSSLCTHPAFRLLSSDTYLLNLPLYHVAGLSLILRAFLRGAAIAIDPFDLKVITHISMVPAMTSLLLNHNPYKNLKALLLGGSSIPLSLANALYEAKLPLYITYGMTEMSSHVFVSKYTPDKGVSFSKPLPRRKVFIDDDGILHVGGCGKFIRYLDKEEKPFHNTKDRVSHINGRYTILGRDDRMFISGGENIYPEEIHEAILSHPLVYSLTVEVKEHMKWGMRPFVRIKDHGPSLCYEDLYTFLSSKLEKFKIPKAHEIDLC